MLAIIWFEIVTKRYDELCHKISRSSLPLKTDSVDISTSNYMVCRAGYYGLIAREKFE